jgi:hypothetical protein
MLTLSGSLIEQFSLTTESRCVDRHCANIARHASAVINRRHARRPTV